MRLQYPTHRLPLLALTTESIDDPRIRRLELDRALRKPLRYRQLQDALEATMRPPGPPAHAPAIRLFSISSTTDCLTSDVLNLISHT